MALIKIKTGGLTADSVNNTILDLADTFAFTGTVSGAGGGKVLQVVNQKIDTSESFIITANVYQDTALTLNITPSASDSKILVMGNFVGSNSAGNYPMYFRIVRVLGGTTTAITQRLGHLGYVANLENFIPSSNATVLDDPQTTSQLTYKCQISCVFNRTVYFNTNYQSGNNNTQSSFLTAIEIGA